MSALPSAVRDTLRAFTRPRDPEVLPVSFDRRRIYVLPTRFGLFFGTLVLSMTIGALNYNNNPALLLALLLAGAAVASLIGAQLQLSALSVIAVEGEPVPAGQPLHLRVHAKAAPDRVRRGLRVDVETTSLGGIDPTAPHAVLHLDQGFGEAALALPTTRRGWFDLPRLRVSTTRPLGLARAWGYAWSAQPLLVYPTPERDGPPVPVGAGNNAQSRLHPAGDDVHHLRNYRRGDARRAISWKHSARRDTLLVREYEQPVGADVALEWGDTAGLPHEARISRLARWVDEAERDGLRYRMRLPRQVDIGPAQGPLHRHTCLRALALMPHG